MVSHRNDYISLCPRQMEHGRRSITLKEQSKGEMYSEMCLLDMLWVSLKKKSWDWGSSLGRKKPAVIGESKRG